MPSTQRTATDLIAADVRVAHDGGGSIQSAGISNRNSTNNCFFIDDLSWDLRAGDFKTLFRIPKEQMRSPDYFGP